MILQGLVEVCIMAFSDKPPVFMKPAERRSMAEGPIVPLLNHSGVLGTPQGASALPAVSPRHSKNGGFQSNCKGNRKSLLIGINYFGTPHELRGCVNDANNVKKLVVSIGFPSSTAKFARPTMYERVALEKSGTRRRSPSRRRR